MDKKPDFLKFISIPWRIKEAVHLAKSAKIFVSDDQKNFKLIKEIGKEEIQNTKGKIRLNVGAQNTKYLKVIVENAGIIPAGNPGADSKAWLFVDEIGVN